MVPNSEGRERKPASCKCLLTRPPEALAIGLAAVEASSCKSNQPNPFTCRQRALVRIGDCILPSEHSFLDPCPRRLRPFNYLVQITLNHTTSSLVRPLRYSPPLWPLPPPANPTLRPRNPDAPFLIHGIHRQPDISGPRIAFRARHHGEPHGP